LPTASDVLLYYPQQTQLNFAVVSEKLGFAEQSVMARYCKRWFNVSPTQLRLQARHLSSRDG
jgi:AraC-like DNA-binding protein